MEINNAQIWKFPLAITDSQKLTVPSISQLLQVKAVSDKLYVWVMVDPTSEKTDIGIEIFGTGHEIKGEDLPYLSYLGTAIMRNGLVWHVFFDTRTRFRAGLDSEEFDG